MQTRNSFKTWIMFTLTVLLVGSACAPTNPTPDLGIEIPDGFAVELYAAGFNRPTQMIDGPDGRIWLAQLNGPETEGNGQVVAFDRADPGQREVLVDGLFKPTGIAVVKDALWIAAGRDLLRANLDDEGMPSAIEVIFEDLPFNGRSNGTLTVTPDGRLIYETSGRRRGDEATEGSASLWSLDPVNPEDSQRIASGLKNAYAHTFDAQGRLWTTEIGDDPVNGGPPPDELNLVLPGADYGWPACFGEQEPALNYGGTEEGCAQTQPAAALFPARSTPTSLVVSPWEENVMLVALWGPIEPSVVRVTIAGSGTTASAESVSTFLTGLAHPQSLLSLDDGSLLVSDHEDGDIYRLSQP